MSQMLDAESDMVGSILLIAKRLRWDDEGRKVVSALSEDLQKAALRVAASAIRHLSSKSCSSWEKSELQHGAATEVLSRSLLFLSSFNAATFVRQRSILDLAAGCIDHFDTDARFGALALLVNVAQAQENQIRNFDKKAQGYGLTIRNAMSPQCFSDAAALANGIVDIVTGRFKQFLPISHENERGGESRAQKELDTARQLASILANDPAWDPLLRGSGDPERDFCVTMLKLHQGMGVPVTEPLFRFGDVSESKKIGSLGVCQKPCGCMGPFCINTNRAHHRQQEKGNGQCDEHQNLLALHQCAGCGAVAGRDKEFSKCSRCKAVRYCSSSCQKAHWKSHKADCLDPGSNRSDCSSGTNGIAQPHSCPTQ